MRAYAIGDIHGHLGKLMLAHDLIEADRRETGDNIAPVIHVGDLVDRGPDSRGVIDHLMKGIQQGANWVVLKGNHDRMFAYFMANPAQSDPRLWEELHWLHPMLGGRETLASYGVASAEGDNVIDIHAKALACVPPDHIDFINSLPLWHRFDEALFVHAGIRPGIRLEDQDEDDLVWIRAEFLNDTSDHGVLIVHGHSPVDTATHYGNRLAIDTGAGYEGPVSAVVIEGRDAWLLTEEGRQPLCP